VTALLAALGALALLTLLPGPDLAVVTRVALAGGPRAAFGAALGISTGCLVWGLFTAAGLAALLAASATAFEVVRVVGAGYLIWLGLRTWWRTRGRPGPPDAAVPATPGAAPPAPGAASLAAGWRTGLATNLLNPKIAVFYTSLLPQLVPPGWPTAPTLVGLVLAHDVMGLLWLDAYAYVLHRGRSTLERPAIRRLLERVTGSALIGFGVRVATQSR
jgi:threonine/homoserine/homoserine lactone efflux protein